MIEENNNTSVLNDQYQESVLKENKKTFLKKESSDFADDLIDLSCIDFRHKYPTDIYIFRAFLFLLSYFV